MSSSPLHWVLAAAAFSSMIAQALACESGSSSDNGTGGPPGAGEIPQAPNPGPDQPGGEPGTDGPPQVLFVGRFELADPKGPKASWPGSRIVTRFFGTSVSVKLS